MLSIWMVDANPLDAPALGEQDSPRVMPALPIGTHLGSYEILGLLGVGGMGACGRGDARVAEPQRVGVGPHAH